MEIVDFTEEYVSGVAEIEQACFANPWQISSIRGELENNCSFIYVAVEDNKPVGYVNVYCVLDDIDVVRVAVLPEYRRRKIAESILKTAMNRHKGTVYLDVRESNVPAINLYKSLGFEDTGVRKNYYTNPTENAVLMKKDNY